MQRNSPFRFHRILLFSGAMLLPATLRAQSPPAPRKSTAVESAEDSAASKYFIATSLLSKGRSFERAIGLLQEAVKREPTNRSYHLALGCALASRAASIGYAAMHLGDFAKDQAKYKTWLAAWEAAQKDRNNPAYRQPRPKPPVLRTKDDGQPFKMTLKEASERYLELIKAEQLEWNSALTLADTKRQRADTLCTRGWGLRMARRFGFQVVKEEALPKKETITNDFIEATQIFPKEARLWQSLGEAERGEDWGEDQSKAIAAYQKAQALDGNFLFGWYRLFEMAQKSAPEQAEQAIRHAAQLDSSNALPLYNLAGILIRKTSYNAFDKHLSLSDPTQPLERDEDIIRRLSDASESEESKQSVQEALTAIEQGNQIMRCTVPIYALPIPKQMQAAWNFYGDTGLGFVNPGAWMAISNPIRGYARVALQHNTSSEAIRAARALIGMGKCLLGNHMKSQSLLDVHDSILTKVSMIMLVSEGYTLLEDIYRNRNEAAHAEQVKAEFEAINSEYQAFRQSQNLLLESSYASN